MSLQPFPLTHVLEARRAPASQTKSLEQQIDADYKAMAELDAQIAGAATTPGSVVLTPAESTSKGYTTIDGVFKPYGNTALRAADARPQFDPLGGPIAEGKGPDQIVFALPIPPESVRYEPVPAQTLTITQGAEVVEDGGQRVMNVTIQGKVGVKHRLGTDRTGSPKFWDSPRLFYELREFVRAVLANNATPGAAPYEIIWRDFKQKVHQRVKIDPYLWEFDDRNKLAPRYEFRLVAFGEVQAEPASFLQDVLGDVIGGAQTVSDYLDTASMWVEIARTNAADALNAVGAILEPIQAIDRLLEAVQGLTGEIRNARSLVKTTIQDVIGIADETIYTIQKAIEDLGISRGDAPWFEDVHASIREAQNAVALSFVVAGLSEQKKDSVYKIKRGDTMAGIARYQYGTESAWPSIAAANKLVPPYISLAKLQGTVGPGDEIVLPAASTPQAIPDVFPEPQHTVEERMFGVDVYRADTTGEWELDAGGDDVRLVRGQDCAEQGLRARFGTIAGSNAVFPTVGMPRSIGEPNYDGTAAVLLTYLTEQAQADDRVDGVEEPQGADGGTSITLSARIRLRGNRTTGAFSLPSIAA